VLEALLSGLLRTWSSVGDLIDEGGPFVFWIFATGLLMWTLILERAWYFRRILPHRAAQALAAWQQRSEHASWCAHQIRRALISRVNAEMTSTLPLLRVLVPLSPLLGLIGTVGGMLEVFDSMALRGSADARAMASGVSHAMICTLTGLAVSISGLYPAHRFQALARRETELLADRLVY
jgi:biopolymer transport protein ExbB